MNFVGCPSCGMELKPHFFESSGYSVCYVCGVQLSVHGFPVRTTPHSSPEQAERGDEEASCFHHELKKAVHSCVRCGKFLCALCTSEVGREVLCPQCLVSGVQGAADSRLVRERTLYDSIALALGIFPVITVWFAGPAGAAAIYTAIRYWNKPGSLVRRYGWRRYLAILFGLGEIAFFILFIVALLRQRTR